MLVRAPLWAGGAAGGSRAHSKRANRREAPLVAPEGHPPWTVRRGILPSLGPLTRSAVTNRWIQANTNGWPGVLLASTLRPRVVLVRPPTKEDQATTSASRRVVPGRAPGADDGFRSLASRHQASFVTCHWDGTTLLPAAWDHLHALTHSQTPSSLWQQRTMFCNEERTRRGNRHDPNIRTVRP